MFTWLCGAFSGALWGAAKEQKEEEATWLYGRSMIWYSLCALIILVLSL